MVSNRSRLKNEVFFFIKKVLFIKNYRIKSALKQANDWLEILGKSSTERGDIKNPERILFSSGISGLDPIPLSIEAMLYKFFEKKGHNCAFVLCNSGLPACEMNIYGNGEIDDREFSFAYSNGANTSQCDTCSKSSNIIFESIGAQLYNLNDFSKKSDIEEALAYIEQFNEKDYNSFYYQGINIAEHANSAALRITLNGIIDFSNPEEKWVYMKELASSYVMVKRYSKLLDNYRPTKVVTVHGIYLFCGIVAEVCRNRNIDVSVYNLSYRKGTVIFSHNDTLHRDLLTDEARDSALKLNLSSEQEDKIDAYLESKILGGREYVNYHQNPILDQQKIIDLLGLDAKKPIISLYTNVLWDAQIFYNNNAFKSMFDWLRVTINYASKQNDWQLVIRIHPAEVRHIRKTGQPILPAIKEMFKKIPDNVFIIAPDNNISSYSLANMSHASIIFGTKIGFEIATKGTPVIVAGEAISKNKGFTYDASSEKEYIRLLDGILDLKKNSDTMIMKAKKFAYYWAYVRMLEMDMLSSDFYNASRDKKIRFYNFNSLDELLDGESKALNAIYNGVINNEPFEV